MAFGTGASSARGGSPGFRFALYAILSIVIMFLDQRWEYLEQVRYGLSIAAYPIELAVSSPSAAWRWIQESVTTRDALREENARLTTRNREVTPWHVVPSDRAEIPCWLLSVWRP